MQRKIEHQPVLLNEVINNLSIKPDGVYVDATFGRGGHSQAILQQLNIHGRLLAIDKDPAAVVHAKASLGTDPRFEILHGSFTNLTNLLQTRQLMGNIDGILLDLGVSSPQLDDPQRGFSFQHDGPLDMRMNNQTGQTAAQWLASADISDIAWVLKTFGEERQARRIAQLIVQQRTQQALTTTRQLADLICQVIPKRPHKKHPATCSFQAIRIYINSELDDVKQVLNQSLQALSPGGRLLVISFHSLEDRIVKRFMRDEERGDLFLSKIPVKQSEIQTELRRIGKMIKPGAAEIAANPRARSSRLRVAEKIG